MAVRVSYRRGAQGQEDDVRSESDDIIGREGEDTGRWKCDCCAILVVDCVRTDRVVKEESGFDGLLTSVVLLGRCRRFQS